MRWRTASRSTRPSPSGSSIRDSIDRLVRAGGLEPPRAFGPTDFRTSYDLRRRLGALAPRRLWSGLSLHPGVAALGAARLVSTPSRRRAWLGIAVTGFPEFGQFCIGGFPPSTQTPSSPLRLPIPPRPHHRLPCIARHHTRQVRTPPRVSADRD